jgi:hypothetical protein
LSDEVDELFGVRPEEFVATRTALAKQLRADGRKDEAAAVAKLRRPSAAAWALNQVARGQPALVAAAIDAGEELRAASERAVAGRPDELRAATAAERAAADAVVKAAAPHLGARADALGPVLLATLRVAALDGAVADELRRGVLVGDHEQPGFGFGLEVDDSPIVRRPPKKPKLRAVPDLAPEPEEDPEAAARATAARAAAREAERARRKERAARQRTAERLTKEATRLAKEADDAEAEAQTARSSADAAQERAAAARLAVDELDD